MCQDAVFFTSVMWCHQPTPWHCNQQLIWLPHHQTSLVPCSSFVMDLLLRRIFECCLFLRWDAIIHSIAQDVAKKTSPLMGVSFRRLSHRNGGQKSCFFSGLTNDWNLGRCTNNTRRNGKQQEEEEEGEEEEEDDRRNRRQKKKKTEETETEEKGQDFYFFETFFVTSKHELLTCFGHLRCCKLRKVPLPYLGFNVVIFFFQRNFPDEERRHTWSDTFFSWMEYIVGISQAEVFFFVVCFLFVRVHCVHSLECWGDAKNVGVPENVCLFWEAILAMISRVCCDIFLPTISF